MTYVSISKRFFSYVHKRYEFLAEITEGLRRYQNDVIRAYIAQPVQGKGDNESIEAYIKRLKTEAIERFGDYEDFVYDFLIDLCQFTPTDTRNITAVNRYKNAFLYALELERNAMNSMSHSGLENSGVDNDSGWTLFGSLRSPDRPRNFSREYSYQLEKMHYLDGTHGPSDALWGRLKVQEMIPALPNTVYFTEKLSDHELYLLVLTALYELSVASDGWINDALPNDKKYRAELAV